MAVSGTVFKPIVSAGATSYLVQEDSTSDGSVSVSLPDNTKTITLRARNLAELKVSSSIGGPYITIKPNCCLFLDNLEFTGKILYIESSVLINTIETLITHG